MQKIINAVVVRLFNNTAIKWAFMLAVALNTAGCASPYMIDRGRDAADIFSATVGLGAGARARAGPVHAGLYGGIDGYGLRGGRLIDEIKEGRVGGSLITDVPFAYGEQLCPAHGVTNRFKDYIVISHGVVLAGYEIKRAHPVSISPYYTEIVLQGGLLLSVRLSFNPGELLDFLLGWFTIDFYGDDIGLQLTQEDLRRLDEASWKEKKEQIYNEERARLSGSSPSVTNAVKRTEDPQIKSAK
jgi:hypothetical protein